MGLYKAFSHTNKLEVILSIENQDLAFRKGFRVAGCDILLDRLTRLLGNPVCGA
jgi:hypothetical protein